MAAAKIQRRQEDLDKFIGSTGWTKRSDRTYVNGYGRSLAGKVTAANNSKSGLKSAGLSDIMNTINLSPISITQETIDNIPYVPIPSLGEEISKRFQKTNRALLTEAKKHPAGTEIGIVMKKDGTTSDPVVEKIGSVSFPKLVEDSYLFHNHPTDNGFTGDDIERFIENDKILELSAEGNKGSLFIISKRTDYDGFAFSVAYKSIMPTLHEAIKDNNPNLYLSTIDDLLEGSNTYGVEFIKRTTRNS